MLVADILRALGPGAGWLLKCMYTHTYTEAHCVQQISVSHTLIIRVCLTAGVVGALAAKQYKYLPKYVTQVVTP